MKSLFISFLLLLIICTSNSRDDSYTQSTTRPLGLFKTERNFKKGRQRNRMSNNVHHYSILMIQMDKTRKRLRIGMGLAQNNCILGGYFCNHNNNWWRQKIEQSRWRQLTFKFGDSIKSPSACFNASFLFHSITFDLVQNIPISNMKLIRLKLLCVSLQSWQGDTTRCQPRCWRAPAHCKTYYLLLLISLPSQASVVTMGGAWAGPPHCVSRWRTILEM